MSRILGRERLGHRIQTDILNSDGSITVHTEEDVEPVFKKVKRLSEGTHQDFKYKASIPLNMIDEVCKIKAAEWGISPKEVFGELLGDSDRAQKVLKEITESSDFIKLQARYH